MNSFDHKYNLLSIIKRHRKDNPVKSDILERQLGIRGAELRDRIRLLRREGFWIGSTAGSAGGYWWTDNRQEYEACISSLRRRALNLLVTIREMRASLNRVQTGKEQTELWGAVDSHVS